uniref:Sig6 n=1 Tax=Arundo donax TaxID=35708 RepID=A0A0A9GWI2_ARUDO
MWQWAGPYASKFMVLLARLILATSLPPSRSPALHTSRNHDAQTGLCASKNQSRRKVATYRLIDDQTITDRRRHGAARTTVNQTNRAALAWLSVGVVRCSLPCYSLSFVNLAKDCSPPSMNSSRSLLSSPLFASSSPKFRSTTSIPSSPSPHAPQFQ